jgi:DNA-binding transcriptional LysR family regulator
VVKRMYIPKLNPQHVITFYWIAKEGGFGAASEKLFVTQSAVTQQMRTLEDQSGVKLFRIRKQRAYLTRAGERFFNYAEEFVHQLLTMENLLDTFSMHSLHVGIASTLMVYLMGILDTFKELHPSVQVSVYEGPSRLLLEELLDFKHDICFTGILSSFDNQLSGFRIPQVEKMVFVASPEFPLSTYIDVTWEELAHQPIIVPLEGSYSREVALSHFRGRGFEPVIGAELANIECLKELVRQKKGIALMFYPNVKRDIAAKKLRIIKVKGCDIRLGIDVRARRELILSPLMEAFVKLIKARFNSEIQELPTIAASNQ